MFPKYKFVGVYLNQYHEEIEHTVYADTVGEAMDLFHRDGLKYHWRFRYVKEDGKQKERIEKRKNKN